MKLGFQGENIAEKFFLATGMLPEMAIVPFFSTVLSQAVMTAQRLGVFARLDKGRMSAGELADELETDAHGMCVLLEALTAFGYLDRVGGKFLLSPEFRKAIDGRMSEMARAMMLFGPDVAKNFEHLDDAIKTGKVDNFHFDPATPTCWSNYLTFLKGVSGEPTKALLKKIKFDTPPRKMLDIAGGPAQYSIAFCREYPGLESKIVDLPEAAAEGQKEIENAGLEGRISYITGNLFETDWGGEYDFALLSNILHALSPEQCQTAIGKAHDALAPGGTIVTNDVDFPGEDGKIGTTAGWSSLLYFMTTGGRSHPTPDIKKWLSDAGFRDIKKTTIRNAAQLCARK